MFEGMTWVSAEGREGWRVCWRDAMVGVVDTWFDTLEEAMAFVKDLGEQTE